MTRITEKESATMTRLVVVGHGPTAYRLIETLVDRGFDGRITVLGRSPGPRTTGWR
nr:hypothetical protein GCM10020093_027100 [Planobispora longispora]